MTIRKAMPSDYDQLVKLYKQFFPVHNIFQRDKDNVKRYLQNQAKDHIILVLEDPEIKAAVILINKFSTPDNSHKVWKLRHFAFPANIYAEQLLTEAEEIIKKKSKTAKIECSIAETEKSIDFYKKHFEQEGVLNNHYRMGETCFLFGKTIS